MPVRRWLAAHWQHIIDATRFSVQGVRVAWREKAFQGEVAVLCIIAIPFGLWLGHSGVERAVLIGSWAHVLVIEFLNCSIEAAIDRISPDRHVLSGIAKDCGSAAVFFSVLLAIVVWALVLFT
jgi:diacylglycerol kinase (ATP)